MYHDTISQGELRTIALALAKENNKKELLALVYIRDVMRPNVNETLSYLSKQGVTIKVISGDYPKLFLPSRRKQVSQMQKVYRFIHWRNQL